MKRPNILFIMSDDHASNAISCYGSKINKTPNIDKIAEEGIKLNNCFCTNSLCAPSRAVILTGKYSHINGVTTLGTPLDGRQENVAKILKSNGYQTAMIGKWHMGHGGDYDPTGFDYWTAFPGQGDYHNPAMYEMGEKKVFPGYATDIVTDLTIDFIKNRDEDKPFFIMCHHKAPHRPCEVDEKHKDMYKDVVFPEPETFHDKHIGMSDAVKYTRLNIQDLEIEDLKSDPPEDLTPQEVKEWKYQTYMRDYLGVVASIDDNVGRLLDLIKDEDIENETIVIYTSDQGFFLGEHGWFDKRFMHEESLRMPMVMKYPDKIKKGTVSPAMSLNLDFAPTFLDYAGIEIHEDMQGISLVPTLSGEVPSNWRKSMYYRYWAVTGSHNISPHYGVRTNRYKLICYLEAGQGFKGQILPEVKDSVWPQWELYDLEKDPYEIRNFYQDTKYSEIIKELKQELFRLKTHYKDYD